VAEKEERKRRLLVVVQADDVVASTRAEEAPLSSGLGLRRGGEARPVIV